MYAFIGAHDPKIAREQEGKMMYEAAQHIANRINRPIKGGMETMPTKHPDDFSMEDLRPAAITIELSNRDAGAYDFAAQANPCTAHQRDDRGKVKTTNAIE